LIGKDPSRIVLLLILQAGQRLQAFNLGKLCAVLFKGRVFGCQLVN